MRRNGSGKKEKGEKLRGAEMRATEKQEKETVVSRAGLRWGRDSP